jgi:hypothetical protein
VTRQAICPEIKYVTLSKTGINLIMTSTADTLVVIGVALGMTIGTLERSAIAFNLVSRQ